MIVTSAQYTLNILGQNGGIKATIDGVVCHVPIDTENTHYQAIQEWVAEGNEPEEADTPAEAGEARLAALQKKLKK